MHVVLLNLVFFTPATAGAIAFAVLVYRVVLHADGPESGGDSGPGTKSLLPARPGGGTSAGPDDLARSA